MLNRYKILGSFVLTLTVASAIISSRPLFWEVSTRDAFLKGVVENLSIDSYGHLMLGPKLELLLQHSSPFLWDVTQSPEGTFYVGSGNNGQVIKINNNGTEDISLDTEELAIHAIAVSSNGTLYAGTSPDGKIYRVDANGDSEVFFDPPDKYIWSLAVHSSGIVYAATGDEGMIYEIAPNGIGTPFYNTNTTNVMTLAIDGKGDIIAGTESPGKIFRIRPSGKPSVLLDSRFNEINSISIGRDGTIFATAINNSDLSSNSVGPVITQPANSPTLTPTVSISVTSVRLQPITTVSAATLPNSSQTQTKGGVYQILTDGSWDLIWESAKDIPYDLLIEPSGSLLIGTGNTGKIYRLAGTPLETILLTRAPAQQVTALLLEENGDVIFTTTNPGKVFRLQAALSDTGHYESEVLDTDTISTWGTIRWRSGTPTETEVNIFTRSGNTRIPDETWSKWLGPYLNPEGSTIRNSKSRYLQWKAVLIGNSKRSPLLTSVTTAYLQRNIQPRVSSVSIEPPGVVFQKPYPSGDPGIAGFDGDTPTQRLSRQVVPSNTGTTNPVQGQRVFKNGLLTFSWKATDDNGDDLEYDILYRHQEQTQWNTLRQKLTANIFVWDTTSVPDGKYIIRIVASDSRSTHPERTLLGHRDSPAFDVDNTNPVFLFGKNRNNGTSTILEFEVSDELSAVKSVEYSLDGINWNNAYPEDGISDSKSEQFEISFNQTVDLSNIVIRATDALNNVTSATP